MSDTPTEDDTPVIPLKSRKPVELANLTALFNETIYEFDFRGLRVRRCGASIEVTTQNEEPLGGYLLMESATIASAHDWLEAKADYYGGN